ncbi:GDSL-type esterase/lipase family protein [Phaeacidiphilus oryzae]|uniref:GDSL-type esterase/lipase family protein n=1 Tax=Phaeacidiphilus oryzae TaxID=348818 RepID=UPI000A8BD481|nr:GDSL-type esterase/lipase family protein [Phaeacidiphilus oryzae]
MTSPSAPGLVGGGSGLGVSVPGLAGGGSGSVASAPAMANGGPGQAVSAPGRTGGGPGSAVPVLAHGDGGSGSAESVPGLASGGSGSAVSAPAQRGGGPGPAVSAPALVGGGSGAGVSAPGLVGGGSGAAVSAPAQGGGGSGAAASAAVMAKTGPGSAVSVPAQGGAEFGPAAARGSGVRGAGPRGGGAGPGRSAAGACGLAEVAPGGYAESVLRSGALLVPAPRFVALGDSVTEGLGDPAPGGRGWRGWAALLAESLGAGDYRNLALAGAVSRDLVERQLPSAAAFRPHLAALVIGGNDTLRAGFDIHLLAVRLDRALGELTALGAVPLTACLPDPGRLLRLPPDLACPLARRMEALNTVVHALSERYGAVHTHAACRAAAVDDPALWSVDRLHPSERGHRMLARAFHAELAARGLAPGFPPAAEPTGAAPGRSARAWWMATRGSRWVLARSTDLLPDLLRLAARERAHRRRGATAGLDAWARARTAAALAALHPLPATADGPAA